MEQDSTIIAVIEMSQSKWLVAAVVPGVEHVHVHSGGQAVVGWLGHRGVGIA